MAQETQLQTEFAITEQRVNTDTQQPQEEEKDANHIELPDAIFCTLTGSNDDQPVKIAVRLRHLGYINLSNKTIEISIPLHANGEEIRKEIEKHPTYKEVYPRDRHSSDHPTIFYEFDKGKKKIVEFDKTLSDYKIPVEKIKKKTHALQYVEGKAAMHWLAPDFCKVCGNKEPRLLEKNGTKYTNPYFIDHTLNLCRECALFSNLDINADENVEGHTQNQPFLLVMGIFLSPAFWVGIALPVPEPVLMLISIIAIIVCVFIASVVFFYKHRKANDDYFKDPYHLVPSYYVYLLYGSLVILNTLNVIELSRLYFYHNINASHQCSVSDEARDENGEYVEECVVYLELIGGATIVLLATLFINVTVCRKPHSKKHDYLTCIKEHELKWSKPNELIETHSEYEHGFECNFCRTLFEDTSAWHCKECCFDLCGACYQHEKEEKKFGESQSHSIKALKEDAERYGDDGITAYYDAAIDIIEEVRVSEAPALPIGGTTKCCSDKCCYPHFRLFVLSILCIIFFILLSLISVYTQPHQYFAILKNNPKHIVSVVISYLIVVSFMCILVVTQYRLTMIYRKSYALMKIPSNALDFIQNKDDDDDDDDDDDLLVPRSAKVKPKFLSAWWRLRKHIMRWELGYFFELTNPIISTEIIFVLGMLILGIIAVFQDEYDGDLRPFLLNLVIKSNVLMILVLFVVMVVITLLVHLYNLLKPYNEQEAHEAWVDAQILSLQFEAAHTDNEKKYEEYKKIITLLETLKNEMSNVKVAPTLLGILTLDKSRIQSIITVITLPLVAFGTTFLEGLFTEIGENSGIVETMSPTTAPLSM